MHSHRHPEAKFDTKSFCIQEFDKAYSLFSELYNIQNLIKYLIKLKKKVASTIDNHIALLKNKIITIQRMCDLQALLSISKGAKPTDFTQEKYANQVVSNTALVINNFKHELSKINFAQSTMLVIMHSPKPSEAKRPVSVFRNKKEIVDMHKSIDNMQYIINKTTASEEVITFGKKEIGTVNTQERRSQTNKPIVNIIRLKKVVSKYGWMPYKLFVIISNPLTIFFENTIMHSKVNKVDIENAIFKSQLSSSVFTHEATIKGEPLYMCKYIFNGNKLNWINVHKLISCYLQTEYGTTTLSGKDCIQYKANYNQAYFKQIKCGPCYLCLMPATEHKISHGCHAIFHQTCYTEYITFYMLTGYEIKCSTCPMCFKHLPLAAIEKEIVIYKNTINTTSSPLTCCGNSNQNEFKKALCSTFTKEYNGNIKSLIEFKCNKCNKVMSIRDKISWKNVIKEFKLEYIKRYAYLIKEMCCHCFSVAHKMAISYGCSADGVAHFGCRYCAVKPCRICNVFDDIYLKQ